MCGINDQRIQRRLLAEPNLTYTKAFELAQATEAADRNAKDLQEKVAGVHAVRKLDKAEGLCRGTSTATCYRCGGKHLAAVCRFKDSECHNCGKREHLAKVCRSKPKHAGPTRQRESPTNKGRQKPSRAHHLVEETTEDPAYTLFSLHGQKANPMLVTVKVDQANLQMEVDTGASMFIISDETYHRLWPSGQKPILQPSSVKLRTYTGEELKVQGDISVTVEYGDQKETLSLLVVAGTGPSLLGRDWLLKVRLDWQNLNRLQAAPPTRLQVTLDRHAAVFKDKLRLVKDVAAKIHVDATAQPRFYKPRTVPYALRAKVDQELEQLEHAGVIEPVQFSDWAALIVPVLKRDGSVRVCGDYKVTVNRAAKPDTYPLPRIDDLFASLAGGTAFTKLDLAHAYQQIPLDEDSKMFVVINTQKGLFRYNRLLFGVALVPGIFQRTIEGILRGILHVCVYIDDILVTGKSEEEHLQTVDEVLLRLEAAGPRLKWDKCTFMLPSVEYLGHTLSAEGLQPTMEKVRAIVEAPTPQNVSQLRSFLGLVNYYGKFLPKLFSTVALLYRLLEKQAKWIWGADQDMAFQAAKKQLTSPCLLVHYDPQKELLLSCDASPYGIGVVLSYKIEDGPEKPVVFSLLRAEKKYAQLNKEGLAIVVGVKKFHDYLLGRKFVFTPITSHYNTYSAKHALFPHKPGERHANADLLSHLPLPETPAGVPTPPEIILMMETLQGTPVSAKNIRQWTDRDPLLSRVRNLVLQGWQDVEDEEILPFSRRKRELSVQDGCVLWGSRVVC